MQDDAMRDVLQFALEYWAMQFDGKEEDGRCFGWDGAATGGLVLMPYDKMVVALEMRENGTVVRQRTEIGNLKGNG